MLLLRNYLDYKKFLADWVSAQPGAGRGQKSKIAAFIGCRSSYLSQVLRDDMHLSAEQAVKVAKFMGLTSIESRYFRLLTDFARAGSEELRIQLASEVEDVRASLDDLGKRMGASRTLASEDQSLYYSSWHYAAIHIMVTIPGLNTRETIAGALNLDEERVAAVLRYLTQVNLVSETDHGQFAVGNAVIHANPKSRNAVQHHNNLRSLSLQSLQNPKDEDLYFSSFVSLSKADRPRVRQRLLDVIDQIQKDVLPSNAEELTVLNIDFWGLYQE